MRSSQEVFADPWPPGAPRCGSARQLAADGAGVRIAEEYTDDAGGSGASTRKRCLRIRSILSHRASARRRTRTAPVPGPSPGPSSGPLPDTAGEHRETPGADGNGGPLVEGAENSLLLHQGYKQGGREKSQHESNRGSGGGRQNSHLSRLLKC